MITIAAADWRVISFNSRDVVLEWKARPDGRAFLLFNEWVLREEQLRVKPKPFLLHPPAASGALYLVAARDGNGGAGAGDTDGGGLAGGGKGGLDVEAEESFGQEVTDEGVACRGGVNGLDLDGRCEERIPIVGVADAFRFLPAWRTGMPARARATD